MRQGRRQYLQRHPPSEPLIDRPKDHGHSAGADLLLDQVTSHTATGTEPGEQVASRGFAAPGNAALRPRKRSPDHEATPTAMRPAQNVRICAVPVHENQLTKARRRVGARSYASPPGRWVYMGLQGEPDGGVDASGMRVRSVLRRP